MNNNDNESPLASPEQTEQPDAFKCLNPNCHREQMARGLCRNCYGAAAGLIRRGKTTWAELERAGKSLPNKNVKPQTSITDWLLPTPTQ